LWHLKGFGGGAPNEHVDSYAWHIEGGVFVIDSSPDPVNFSGPTPIPGAPGHCSIKVAPGITTQIEVTLIPNR
jgi:hypothetical protein